MTPLPTPPAPGERSRRSLASGVFIAFGALAVLAWIGIIIGSIRKTPGIEGVLGGIFGGLFVALLVAVAGAWLAMRVAFPPSPRVVDPAEGADLEASLRDVLDELEKSRLETVRQINQPVTANKRIASAAPKASPGDLRKKAATVRCHQPSLCELTVAG